MNAACEAAMMTALVVEDEILVRLDLVDRLEEAGYRVREAGSASEAIAILENDCSIRVVFTDIHMPGDMDGLALAKCIRERWPPTIIVISSANSTGLSHDIEGDIHQLDKPCDSEQLKMIVDAVSAELSARSH